MNDHSQIIVITSEHAILGTQRGTVRVTSGGTLCLDGTLQGTLDIQAGGTVRVNGQQQGTVAVAPHATVTVFGAIQGTTSLERGASLTIEPSGKLAGTLVNDGLVVVRGVFAGAQSGNGTIRLEGDGYIKQPASIKDGVHYYEW